MALIVNGETIPEEIIQRECEQLRPHYRQAFPEQPEEQAEKQLADWSRENVIERVLLAQEARRRNEPIPEEESDALLERLFEQHGGREAFLERFGLSEERLPEVRADLEAQWRTEKLLEGLFAEVGEPDESELRAYYDGNSKDFVEPEVVNAAHIVKHVDENCGEEEAREAIEKARRKLRNGGFFSEVAEELSDCPANGGALGFFPRGQMVEEFEEVVFNMQPGEVSDVFRTPFGFHIARVEEKRGGGELPFEQVQERLKAQLTEERRRSALESFVDTLKEKAEISEG